MRFYRHPLSTWGTTSDEMVTRDLMVAASEAVDLQAVHFADKLRQTGMPSFMKIDIEGSDMLCLQALLEFERRPQSVSVESHKTDWSRIEQEFELLARLGYDRFAVVQQGDIPGKRLETKKLDGSPLTSWQPADVFLRGGNRGCARRESGAGCTDGRWRALIVRCPGGMTRTPRAAATGARRHSPRGVASRQWASCRQSA